jgi:hypothetical protein
LAREKKGTRERERRSIRFSFSRREKGNKMDPPDKPLSASSIVTLCVGGQEFATTVTTLRKVKSLWRASWRKESRGEERA